MGLSLNEIKICFESLFNMDRIKSNSRLIKEIISLKESINEKKNYYLNCGTMKNIGFCVADCEWKDIFDFRKEKED
jgi:hypothetical protein